MLFQQTSYLLHKLEARPRPETGECGVYAREKVYGGELLIIWGGDIITIQQLNDLSPRVRQHTIQVEENLFLAPTRAAEPADYVNHSCDPNAGLSGQISLVALRDIRPNEEICFDYAMCDGSPYDEFDCVCQTSFCRGHISGNDWQRPELWQRYAGHFSPYLQRRIDRLQVRVNGNGKYNVVK